MSLRRRVAILLAALWFAGGVPILSTGIDWVGVCSCDVCPFEGGPSCCCAGYSPYGEGQGAAGQRAMLRTPSVERGPTGCPAGAAALPGDTSSIELARADSALGDRSPIGSSARPSTDVRAASRPLLPLLPRPPPSPLRSNS